MIEEGNAVQQAVSEAGRRMRDPDGHAVDVFPVPVGEASVAALLRDLFATHWQKIVFGPIIEGAAWESVRRTRRRSSA
jgi:hypothetical protein